MKVYILRDADFAKLLVEIDRGLQSRLIRGAVHTHSDVEKKANNRAHRFYNYIIRKWMDEVKG